MRESLVGIIGRRGSNRIESILKEILHHWVLEYAFILHMLLLKFSKIWHINSLRIKTIKELVVRLITT